MSDQEDPVVRAQITQGRKRYSVKRLPLSEARERDDMQVLDNYQTTRDERVQTPEDAVDVSTPEDTSEDSGDSEEGTDSEDSDAGDEDAVCGAETSSGDQCSRTVDEPGEKCFQHDEAK